MLLAKIALGFCGTVTLAGVYTFHEGVMSVQADEVNGRHVHVWLPAAIVPMAMHVVPSDEFRRAAKDLSPWMPTVRAMLKELKKYPEAELVDVEGVDQHVRIRVHSGKLTIDVKEPGDSVHVACPLAMIEHVSRELEAKAPTI